MIGRRTLRKWWLNLGDWQNSQRRKWGQFSQRLTAPITRTLIDEAVGQLFGDNRPEVLLLHASLSQCGYIRGGANTIIDVVSEYCSTLCMPAHSYCYPSKRETVGPIFDRRTTPSVVGHVSNVFRVRPGVSRSLHPTHSLAAIGPDAEWIVFGHENCSTPSGRATPYDKLLQRDATVLMFGATLEAYTLFHTSTQLLADADDCRFNWLYFQDPVHLRYREGSVKDLMMRRQNWTIKRRFAEMDEALEEAGLLKRQRLRRGELLLIPSSHAVHGFITSKMDDDPYYLIDTKQGDVLHRPRAG